LQPRRGIDLGHAIEPLAQAQLVAAGRGRATALVGQLGRGEQHRAQPVDLVRAQRHQIGAGAVGPLGRGLAAAGHRRDQHRAARLERARGVEDGGARRQPDHDDVGHRVAGQATW
jgi:hypothetical protein